MRTFLHCVGECLILFVNISLKMARLIMLVVISSDPKHIFLPSIISLQLKNLSTGHGHFKGSGCSINSGVGCFMIPGLRMKYFRLSLIGVMDRKVIICYKLTRLLQIRNCAWLRYMIRNGISLFTAKAFSLCKAIPPSTFQLTASLSSRLWIQNMCP